MRLVSIFKWIVTNPWKPETISLEDAPEWLQTRIKKDWNKLGAMEDGHKPKFYYGHHFEYQVIRYGQGHGNVSITRVNRHRKD